MRTLTRSLPHLAAPLALGAALACTAQEQKVDADGGSGGGGAVAGAGGGAGADGGGAGGTGGADPCNGVGTRGRCVSPSQLESCVISDEPGEPPTLRQIDCRSWERCDDSGDVARCVPTGDCREGTVECKDASTLRTCTGGVWVETPCGANACEARTGFGAACIAQEAGSGIRVTGRLLYEFRQPNHPVTPTSYSSSVTTEGGGNFLVTVYDGEDLLGIGLTSPGDTGRVGDFDIELSRAPTQDTLVYFWSVIWSDRGQPLIAVVRNESSDPIVQRASEYWWWGTYACDQNCGDSTIDIGDFVVREGDGSGAAHIFQWAVFDYFRFRSMPRLDAVDPYSVAIFWRGPDPAYTADPLGIKCSCGNCFLPPSLGGATIATGATTEQDHYDTSMCISGKGSATAGQFDYDSHWSRSTINHEIGHWNMQSWSRSPGEGGPHYVDDVSLPGLSYSEAWATFSGQSNISISPAQNDPVYFTVQRGTGFWVNLASARWSGGPLVRPNPNGPIAQNVNENVVAAMMFSLWASQGALTPQGLGDAPMFSALQSRRLLQGPNRGYPTVDFVDYLDALVCDNLADATTIANVVEPMGYPWRSSDVTCP